MDDLVSHTLERFLILAKASKGAGCRIIIDQVLSAPDVHVFGELLALPNVQQLATTVEKPYFDLLEIFAYGTYSDYCERAASLPQLSDVQRLKLRLLTIISLAAKSKAIPYRELMQVLGLENLRELEDTIIEVIYRGLLCARLDQIGQQLLVESVVGRDIKQGDVQIMMETMRKWSANCERLLHEMEEKMAFADEQKTTADRKEQELAKTVETLKAEAGRESSDKGAMAMGVDGDFRSAKNKRAHRSKEIYPPKGSRFGLRS